MGTVVGSSVGVSGDAVVVISVTTDVGSVTSDGLSFLAHPVKHIVIINAIKMLNA